ncbi:putative sulfate exporter family transporter [Mycobacterium ahvazicum]|uniref:Sulfate exporter family transporter n=1 Tax=Mycobacterium ahvazicum TaxID=1964395 RepID=A0A2K4YFI3_9MYCO|nr:YeiH family protein [Mycobacterium ahvazicum]SOX55537.1 putative sulfate exporter family transporter [Mycobacterium ahvazicum]
MRFRRFRGDRVSTTRVEADETLDEPTFTSRQPLDYVPGVVLLIGVGLLGKYAQLWWNTLAKHEHWRVPDIEYVLWAIVIGLLITNTIGLHRIFRPGVQTYEFWLKVGIVVLGARFVLGDIVKLGAISLVQILVDMTIAGTVIIVVARAFGLSGKLGSLLAIGTSICGVSAIIAAKGAIRARNSDVSYAIAAILALGAVSLFVLPPLGHAIGLTDHEFGLWAGLSVDNTAETTATGYLFSDHAGKIAVLVKSTRNALIGFVVLGFALYWAARGQADEIAPGATAKASFIWQKFPKFVLGFLAVSAIATAGWLTKGQTANLANVSKWAFLLTFAGVGLSTDFRQIARTGWRPLLVAVIGLTVVATVSLGIVLLTSRVLHWGVST